MAHGSVDGVVARAGRIGQYFSIAGNRPNLVDIGTFLDELSGLVDEALAAHDITVADLDANSLAALDDLVNYGALARALRGIGDRSPQVQAILTEADAVWQAAMGDPTSRQPEAIRGSIAVGDHPVVRAISAGVEGVGQRAGQVWDDEPDYGRPYERLDEYWALRGTNLAPGFSRGQKF